eukprot:gene9618-1840_t
MLLDWSKQDSILVVVDLLFIKPLFSQGRNRDCLIFTKNSIQMEVDAFTKLATYQKRIRHIEGIQLRNVTPTSFESGVKHCAPFLAYFTISAVDVLYESEVILCYKNACWRAVNLSCNIASRYKCGHKLTIKVWVKLNWDSTVQANHDSFQNSCRDDFQLLRTYRVDLFGLSHIGETLVRGDQNALEKNVLYISLRGIWHILPAASDLSQTEPNTSATISFLNYYRVRAVALNKMYTKATLARLISVYSSVAQARSAMKNSSIGIQPLQNQLRWSIIVTQVSRWNTNDLFFSVPYGESLNKKYESLTVQLESLGRQKNLLDQREAEMNKILLARNMRQAVLALEVYSVYNVKPVTEKLCSIMGIELPNGTFYDREDESMATALGHVAHLVLMISKYLQLPLRYPIRMLGSRSSIVDDISYDRPERQHRYPLHPRVKDRSLFEHGVFLLNKNVQQLLEHHGVLVHDTLATLPNIRRLMLFLYEFTKLQLPLPPASSQFEFPTRNLPSNCCRNWCNSRCFLLGAVAKWSQRRQCRQCRHRHRNDPPLPTAAVVPLLNSVFTFLEVVVRHNSALTRFWPKNNCRLKRLNVTIAFLGPGSAGKSSLTAVLQREPLEDVTETIGQSVFHFRRSRTDVTAFDLGGGDGIRDIWQRYFAEINAFVFVVDASKPLDEARKILWEMVSHRFVGGKPVLILANKQDRQGACDAEFVTTALELDRLASTHGQSPFHVFEISAQQSKRTNIIKALDWLLDEVKREYDAVTERHAQESKEQQTIEERELQEKRERIQQRRKQREREEAKSNLSKEQETFEFEHTSLPNEIGDQPAGGEHSRVDISNEHCKSDVQVFKDVESSPFKPTVQDLHIEPISFNNTAPNQHDTTVNANATAHVDQRRHNNKIIEQSHHLTELNTQHVFSNNTINEKKTLADSNVDYNTDSHLRQLDQALFLPTKQSTFLKTDGVSLNARQSKEKQQPQSHHKLTQPMQPLHPLDIISSVKSIKDAPLTQLVRRAADACAKMAHTSPPDDNSLEWKLYRAACKECWQQIIKQARKGKRFSMDRLAVQAHTGWSAVVKHVWDESCYGPRPDAAAITEQNQLWPKHAFSSDIAYAVYLDRITETKSYDNLPDTKKERYRIIAETREAIRQTSGSQLYCFARFSNIRGMTYPTQAVSWTFAGC